MVSIRPCDYSTSQRSNFLHRFLGTDVLFSDKEHHVLNKLERMIQHEAFHFEIVPTAPVLSCQECPSNFDFRSLRIVTIKPTRSDHLLTLFIYYHKRAAGFRLYIKPGACAKQKFRVISTMPLVSYLNAAASRD